MVKRISLLFIIAFTSLTVNFGCLAVKTEHEIKPIHITMDINLKIDKELDEYFDDVYGEETTEKPKGEQ